MTCPKCESENTAKAIFTAYYCLTCGWVWEDETFRVLPAKDFAFIVRGE